MGESYDYFVVSGARYWELIDVLFGVIEEIKNPCQCKGFECVDLVTPYNYQLN